MRSRSQSAILLRAPGGALRAHAPEPKVAVRVRALAAQLVFALMIAAMQGPMPAYMAEMFPTHIRSSAIGIAYNLSVGVLGGTAPLVSTWLIAETGNLAAPALYLVALAGVSATALLTLRIKERAPLA